ncbi:hypothetical protein [Candidatus Poriferisodalis sp.]|uniref:hypothetical protein n=1 Tax=Candidatus Poriferisodalis sp. TaxID=3101277 RepID=UPI003B019462
MRSVSLAFGNHLSDAHGGSAVIGDLCFDLGRVCLVELHGKSDLSSAQIGLFADCLDGVVFAPWHFTQRSNDLPYVWAIGQAGSAPRRPVR